MASYAPAFGMMGTVMGLIIMMTSQGETNSVAVFGASQSQDMMGKLLSGMGLALVTTLYGVVLSNLVFLPISGKLRSLSDSEQHAAEIMIVGIQSLQRQDSPMRTKDELLTFVSKHIRDEVDRQRSNEGL
jgi:chemotaxis protein MotA